MTLCSLNPKANRSFCVPSGASFPCVKSVAFGSTEPVKPCPHLYPMTHSARFAKNVISRTWGNIVEGLFRHVGLGANLLRRSSASRRKRGRVLEVRQEAGVLRRP